MHQYFPFFHREKKTGSWQNYQIGLFALLFKNGTFGHKIYIFLHTWRDSLMPSGTILKVVQKSPIYIFVMK